MCNVVKQGTWKYNGEINCVLRIIKSNILFGSGDYEDEPGDRDDKEIECYYIEFESTIEKGVFNARSSGFLTIDEAIGNAEKLVNQQIKWD